MLKPTGLRLLALALLLCHCTPQETDSQMPSPKNSAPAAPVIRLGNATLKVEIVQNDEERMRGLMYREQLAEDEGMLFVFEEARIQAFWMRNTFIPLDIAFIDAGGKIIDIQRMEPLDETKSYFSPAPVPYVLEVNAGWFERNAIKVGELVKF